MLPSFCLGAKPIAWLHSLAGMCVSHRVSDAWVVPKDTSGTQATDTLWICHGREAQWELQGVYSHEAHVGAGFRQFSILLTTSSHTFTT